MSTLNITADELADLVTMKDEGLVAEAWNYLGSKGDAYAYLAGASDDLIEGDSKDHRLYGGAGDDYPEMQAALGHEGCTIVLCHSVN